MWTRCGLINLFPGRWHLHMRNDFVFEFPRPAMPNMVYTGGFRSLFRVLGSAGSSSWPLEHWWESFLGMSRRRSPRPLLSCLRSCRGTWDEAPSASATTRYWSTGCHRTTCSHIPKLESLSPMEALMGSRRQFSMTTCPDSEQREELWFWTSPRWIGTCSQMPWRGLVTIPLIDSMQKRSRLHRDQPMKPLDLAVFCIEYLMRHKGAQHLRTHVNEMSWFVIKAIKIKLN